MSQSNADQPSRAMSAIGAIVRAGLNTAPFTGGIASLWSEWDTERRFKRIESTLQLIGEELRSRKSFDPNRVGEPEMQLLEDLLQRAAREHRKAKRVLFGKLLASNWEHTDYTFDERLLFQRALDDFDGVHLRIMDVLQGAHQNGIERVHATDLCKQVCGDDAGDDARFGVFVPSLNKLSAEYGFVRRRGEDSGKVMMNINPDGLVFHTLCQLSPAGRRFIESVRDETERA